MPTAEAIPPAYVGIHAGRVVFQEGRLLRPDGEHRRPDRRVRQARRGAREPGGGGRGRRNTGELHGDRTSRVEGRVGHPPPPYGPTAQLSPAKPVGGGRPTPGLAGDSSRFTHEQWHLVRLGSVPSSR